ncbi:malto-oligosyltrehalose trehalohydrolase [Ohtaekwangia koreensis]|uniref:Malto-oligosyltrehalose trehalohydrolase n=1 Tax=Ohtaekwangia koreensis TaxID=688867 RepID=A0A1T5JT03_9BACT|nr:malto-oligosyltrehalose trehalohydrolase [Ohtaekwangia koreensis]SKC54612.1 maltooligosyltrehalose trehalohydrolase [Ohtaekwangia koreensis]
MRIFGSEFSAHKCAFSVWAPEKKTMLLHIVSPEERTVEMEKDASGYFYTTLKNIDPGTRYFFMPDGKKDVPDPASHYQPLGVKGPSEIVDHYAFEWEDQAWRGIPLQDYIIYEMHIGTFTQAGTFEAAIQQLDDLLDIGVNAIQIMPVSQFSGERNWGYDGVFPYAVQNSYGGPDGLKKLVNACHKKGMAVILDVVYNHIGPEGNCFSEYANYFTDTYRTPWGQAINYDGEWSDGVRDYFSSNPIYWFSQFHFDALRVDAIHTVFDTSAVHFWEQVNTKVKSLEKKIARPIYMIAESDLNSTKVIKSPEDGGYGFDAQWLDDFHHALYVLLDKNGKKRYEDFGSIEQLQKAYNEGFVLSGEFVKFRKRRYGSSSVGVSGNRFVVFTMNHDQVGNRVRGERLCSLLDFERLKLAAAAFLFSPYIPMLFMGEEYADESPFFYFISHEDSKLIEAVREGRKKEFAPFKSEGEPPDAYAPETFYDSKLKWQKRNEGKHGVILRWHKKLISMRTSYEALQNMDKKDTLAHVVGEKAIALHRKREHENILCLFNFSEQGFLYTMPAYGERWERILDSREAEWSVDGSSNATSAAQINAGQNMQVESLQVLVYKTI